MSTRREHDLQRSAAVPAVYSESLLPAEDEVDIVVAGRRQVLDLHLGGQITQLRAHEQGVDVSSDAPPALHRLAVHAEGVSQPDGPAGTALINSREKRSPRCAGKLAARRDDRRGEPEPPAI